MEDASTPWCGSCASLPRVSKVYCAPGNGGIAEEAECLPADVKNIDSLVAVADQIRPDLTVVGPELPSALGVVDEFTRRGWRVFGPTKAAAQLESSKSFAKEFLQAPSHSHRALCDLRFHRRSSCRLAAFSHARSGEGRRSGCRQRCGNLPDERRSGLSGGRDVQWKDAGRGGTAEWFWKNACTGDELSFLVLSDGERVAPLVAAQDHKRIGDGDTGPEHRRHGRLFHCQHRG